MSNTGRFYVRHGGRTFIVEPISNHPDRNADWTNGGIDKIKGGAIRPEDSIIKDDEVITTLGPGESPLSFINNLLREDDKS